MHIRSFAARRARASVVVSVALLLGAACGTGMPSATQAPSAARPPGRAPAPPVPELAWQPCGPDLPGRECATAAVPLDYDRPAGATTQVALARIPASDAANRIGSVFLNPGGPGESGVGVVLSEDGPGIHARLRGRFDVVGFDPRGVGASDPLRCFDTEEERDAYIASVPRFPYRSDQYRPFFDAASNLVHVCLDDRPVVAAHMSTADVARDLDLLRQAVGDARLTYVGFSYGSYLGATYANLFPGNVRALVVDGVLDPRRWSAGRQIEIERTAGQEELDELLRLCDEAGEACAFSAPEGSAARWEALAAALEAEPLALPDGTQYTYDLLIHEVGNALYRPELWGGPDGGAALLDALADAVLGDQGSAASAAAAEAATVRRALADQLTDPEPAPPPVLDAPADPAGADPAAGEDGADQLTDEDDAASYDNGPDAFFGNHCADAEYPRSLAGFRAVGADAAAASRLGPWFWWVNAGCSRWPVNHDRYVGPWTARTSAPVLVVGNRFDGITGYAGAEALADLLPGSRLLTYAGWGHTAFGRSACVSDHVLAYLLEGTLPPDGTVCPANPNPFVPAGEADADADQPLTAEPPTWEVTP